VEVDENIVTSEAGEEREQERLSVVATIGILAATIAAAICGSLAALAAVHADDANSARVAWATYSNELLLAQNEHTVAQNGTLIARIEAAWRLQFLADVAANSSDPTLVAALGGEASSNSSQPNFSAPPQLSFASPSPAGLCRGPQPEDCAYEVANAYGTTALNDDRQERVYIACVSMLAIALFLFALSKMLSQTSMERLFLVLGTVITLVAVGWMAANPVLTPAHQPSATAIRSFERGWQLEQQGRRPATVVALLERATTEDPSLADGWQQLGQEELLQPPKDSRNNRCPTAIDALTHAWQVRQASDDLDRLAVGEVLCGQPDRALATLRAARPDPADTSAGPALALTQLASGHLASARSTLDAAVQTMEHQGGGKRGPVFRTYWFDQLRTEVRALDARGRGSPDVHAFLERMLHDEALATLSDYGLHLPTPAPGAVVAPYTYVATPQLGTAAGMQPVMIVLGYQGLRNGDVLTVTWDQASTVESSRAVSQALPGASVVVVGQAGGPLAGSGAYTVPAVGFVRPGTYSLNVSLDAAPSTPRAVNIPKTGSSFGPSQLVFTPPPGSTSTTTAPCANSNTTTTTTIAGLGRLAFTC
jgi:hypothetical protein